jgi:GDPmannose 4,6-dehydratase
LEFKGEGVNEKGFIKSIDQEKYSKATGISNPVEENNDQRPTTNVQPALGKEVLSVDPTYFRPTEVDLLIGDPTKAKEMLGWVPEHDLASLVKDMMKGDVLLMKKDVDLLKAGHEILKQAE